MFVLYQVVFSVNANMTKHTQRPTKPKRQSFQISLFCIKHLTASTFMDVR